MVQYYRLACGLFVLMWLGFVVTSILISVGVMDPPLSLTAELLTPKGSPERAAEMARSRENAPGVGVIGALGALLYGVAAVAPRKPWGWSVGMIALFGMVFPFVIPMAIAIPLLLSWFKPETKRFFSMRL